MTKTDLVQRIAESTHRTKKEAEESIDTVLAGITEALASGNKVDLRGFGSFQISERKERQGRNPRTGEAVTIAARKAAVFKPSKELSERINGAVAPGGERVGASAHDDLPSAEPSAESAKVHGDKIT